MGDKASYHEQVKIKNILKLREMEKKLPPFCAVFFRGINDRVSTRTQVSYAYDLVIFFNFINENVFDNAYSSIRDIKLEDLERVEKFDLENFLEYLAYYENNDGLARTNNERGKGRKLSSVKSMYNYFYESELIKKNPASIVHVPKIHEKNIIRLEGNEVSRLLDVVENGSEQTTKHQEGYHKKTVIRDTCLVTLLLGTGIRVSECVGLNLDDLDFENNAIRIVRKGGNEARVYFGDEVREAMLTYLAQRKAVIPAAGSEKALFLSMQNKRISVRAVEILIKKYASQVTTLKKITPHKLRSTYGTELYRESNDIYLVASVLGHKDVNTTRKHYASMDEEQRKKAANYVKLRKD